MNIKSQSPYAPCDPGEFAGRSSEKKQLLDTLTAARERGKFLLVTGPPRSGKSSFIKWWQRALGEAGIFSVSTCFPETPGMILSAYRDVLLGLIKRKKKGLLNGLLNKDALHGAASALIESIDALSSPAVPGEMGAKSAAARDRLLTGETFDHEQALTAMLGILNELSNKLQEEGEIAAIFLDDAQWASGPGFRLLCDLAGNVPKGIAIVAGFSLEDAHKESYEALRKVAERHMHEELAIGPMPAGDIKDLAEKRFGQGIDYQSASFLSEKVGDLLGLVASFELLKGRGLECSLSSFEQISAEASDPAGFVYEGIDEQWKNRLSELSILRPPLALDLIACMLHAEDKRMDVPALRDDLRRSAALRTIDRDTFDFAHPSFREHFRNRLPDDAKTALHLRAAECYEPKAHLAGRLSHAEHLFLGGKHESAYRLCSELADMLYDLTDFDLAIELIDRAVACAEITDHHKELARALHRKGVMLQSLLRYDDALGCYQRSLSVSTGLGDLAAEARTLYRMGVLHQENERLDEALDSYQKSLTLSSELGDRAGQARTLHQIGVVHELLGRLEEALYFYQRSLALEREVGNKEAEEAALKAIEALKQKTRRG